MASSQGMTNQKTPGDLIIDSLEDLKVSEFSKFQNKLTDFTHGDKLRIPRGKLENAGWIQTKDLLIDTYGQEGALDVVIEVFKLINLRGPAENLQERREENAKLKIITNNNRLKEWRKEYMESMKDAFQRIKEHNTPRGETVSLEKRYTNLKLIKGPQIVGDNLNQGREPPQNVNKKSNENLLLTIQTLFDPDSDGHVPKIVVLQGPAGIGKTMTSQKIMLDWASGNLYQDKFDFVFHLSCRELNNIKENISLIDLLSRTSRLQSSDDLVPILKDSGCQGKLLFVVDGFDELKWTLEEGSEVCRDVFGKTHKDLLLQKLLMKEALKQSSLIITTRPLALGKLHTFVEDARHVQILGFAKEDRVEYFHNFFKNEIDAEKALSLIKDHDILNTLCEIPIVCWIVCTVMKLQINQDFNLQQYRTITSIYLLYLRGLIKHHVGNQSVTTCLRKLCALAKEGVLNQKMIFDMEDLDKQGLSLSELGSVFMNEKILFQDIDTQTCYTFIHLSVQEFLAALYYVLDDGSKYKKRTTGRRMITSIPEICKGNSLSEMCVQYPHLTLSVRFLFGLFNEKEVRKFSESTGIIISLPGRRAMQDWLFGNWLWKDSLTGDTKAIHCSEAFSCLYETQDQFIIKRIMPSSPHLELFGTQKGPFWSGENCSKQLCYCLMTCGELRSLSFTYLLLDPKYLQMLSPLLHRCHQLSFLFVKVRSGDVPGVNKLFTNAQYDEFPNMLEELIFPSAGEVPADLSWLLEPQSKIKALKFNHCGLTASACSDICAFMKTSKRLTSLDLSDNKLRDPGVKILCEGLKDPGCTLKELRMWQCHLTPLCCEDLYSLLVTNRSLINLDLSSNILCDIGIKRLFEGLKDPHCTLQILNIYSCGLTPLSCADLQSVLISNRSLITLVFSMCLLEDSGIKVICEGLKHPDCTLQELGATFDVCRATLSCFDDILSVISTNQTLITLETCFQNEMDISESEHCFEELRRLGCIVQKVRPFFHFNFGPEGGTQKEMKALDIIYKKTPLAN